VNKKQPLREQGEKRCSSCKQVKPLDDFPKCGISSTGLQMYRPKCRACTYEHTAKKSRCALCPKLGYCRSIMKEMVPLYCDAHPEFIPPGPADWVMVWFRVIGD